MQILPNMAEHQKFPHGYISVDINEGLVSDPLLLLEIAQTVLILINTGQSINVN